MHNVRNPTESALRVGRVSPMERMQVQCCLLPKFALLSVSSAGRVKPTNTRSPSPRRASRRVSFTSCPTPRPTRVPVHCAVPRAGASALLHRPSCSPGPPAPLRCRLHRGGLRSAFLQETAASTLTLLSFFT